MANISYIRTETLYNNHSAGAIGGARQVEDRPEAQRVFLHTGDYLCMAREGADIMKKLTTTWTAWGIRWESENNLDGVWQHLICVQHWYSDTDSVLTGCRLMMFNKKKECQKYINDVWGYLFGIDAKYLRKEPHGWRIPKAVKITITAEGEAWK